MGDSFVYENQHFFHERHVNVAGFCGELIGLDSACAWQFDDFPPPSRRTRLAMTPQHLTFATQGQGIVLSRKQRTLWADDPPVPGTRRYRPIRAAFRHSDARASI
ncbi:MAG: hypothetical protein K2Q29_08890 [Sphingomonadales bacterium]|jgi:hypothetical protein|nr:hypothetical protein [Sphingomonadales bacterium]